MLSIFIAWSLGATIAFLTLISLAVDHNEKINANVLKMFLLASVFSWLTVFVYLVFLLSSKINGDNRS